MNELTTIKEVQEGGKHLANWYLKHGYVLLDIQGQARARKYPEAKANGELYYVYRNPIYVVGRPDGVEPAPLIPGLSAGATSAADNI